MAKVDVLKVFESKRRFIHQAPDKLRLAGSLIKNKNVLEAISILSLRPLAASKPLILTLKQAQEMAKHKDITDTDLYVKTIKVDEGPKLKRRRIIHRGRATAILKRMAHVTLILEDKSKLSVKKPDEKVLTPKVKGKKDDK